MSTDSYTKIHDMFATYNSELFEHIELIRKLHEQDKHEIVLQGLDELDRMTDIIDRHNNMCIARLEQEIHCGGCTGFIRDKLCDKLCDVKNNSVLINNNRSIFATSRLATIHKMTIKRDNAISGVHK